MLTRREARDRAVARVREKKEQERAKALAKYGPEALAPGGRPEFDILDYLINEVIGLERYAEMLDHRSQAWDPDLRHDVRALTVELHAASRRLGPQLTAVQLLLLDRGVSLGTPEKPVQVNPG